jgi:hypothetical protein
MANGFRPLPWRGASPTAAFSALPAPSLARQADRVGIGFGGSFRRYREVSSP